MKHRKYVVAASLMIGVFAMVGLMLCTNNSAKAAPSLSEVMSILPSDSQFALGMNVQKLVASPNYAKFKQKQTERIGNDLSQFIAATGVDPERDIYYLAASGKAKPKASGVIIAFGNFNQDKITSFIQSQAAAAISVYGGRQVLAIPGNKGSAANKGIVFFGDKIAAGDMETLYAMIDGRTGSAAIAPLIHGINPEEMFWFAGNADGIPANASLPIPAGVKIPPIQNIVGTLDISDLIAGKITATAVDMDSAKKLADAINGAIAFGQLAGKQDPILPQLLGGLKLSQSGAQVSLDFSFSADLLDRLEQVKKMTQSAIIRSDSGTKWTLKR